MKTSGCLNKEILADTVADETDRKRMLEVRVIQKNRNGKSKMQATKHLGRMA